MSVPANTPADLDELRPVVVHVRDTGTGDVIECRRDEVAASIRPWYQGIDLAPGLTAALDEMQQRLDAAVPCENLQTYLGVRVTVRPDGGDVWPILDDQGDALGVIARGGSPTRPWLADSIANDRLRAGLRRRLRPGAPARSHVSEHETFPDAVEWLHTRARAPRAT